MSRLGRMCKFNQIFYIINLFLVSSNALDLVSLGAVDGDDFFDLNCKAPIFRFRLGECEGQREAKLGFLLFTKDNPVKGYPLKVDDLSNLKASPYISGANLKILIHGYIGTIKQAFATRSINAYTQLQGKDAVNVIAIDWEQAASGGFGGLTRPYARSAGCTLSIARRTAKLIKFLVDNNYVTLEQIHLVGHSLGAHTAGMIGKEFDGKIGRITGLDPARPCFRRKDMGFPFRLNKQDAEFVDIIHTDGEIGSLLGHGLIEQLGHADYYPNGGLRLQPGCQRKRFSLLPDNACGHNRAPDLFAESILSPKAFIGRRCDSWEKFQSGDCSANRAMGVMGEHARRPLFAPFGIKYYLRTSPQPPYGLGSVGAQTGNS